MSSGTALIRVVDGEIQTGNEFALAIQNLTRAASALEVVKDRETCGLALEVVSRGKADIKSIMALAEPERVRLDKLKKDLLADRDQIVAQIEAVISPIERQARDWNILERQRAEAEERRLNEERQRKAREEAEAERKRVAAQAEADRKAREKEIEAQRKAGELNKREADRLKREAEEAARKAKEQAEADAKAQAAVAPVQVKPNTAAAPGVSARMNWKFRIVDANKIPRTFLMPDEQAIGVKVRGMKDKAATEALIPGIEVYND
jgi:pyruvate/2-oxoglutarate dehydrogenase complex dihydrolipoamide acyltransferase (E2) component